jgi:hypothetical protein
MKWSQGLCASILVDALYFHAPAATANPRMGRDFPVSPDPAFRPNAFAADWQLAPEALGVSMLDLARPGGTKRRAPDVSSES